MLSVKQEVSSTIFKVFGMTRPGIEMRSPGPLANILPTRPQFYFLGFLLNGISILMGYLMQKPSLQKTVVVNRIGTGFS